MAEAMRTEPEKWGQALHTSVARVRSATLQPISLCTLQDEAFVASGETATVAQATNKKCAFVLSVAILAQAGSREPGAGSSELRGEGGVRASGGRNFVSKPFDKCHVPKPCVTEPCEEQGINWLLEKG